MRNPRLISYCNQRRLGDTPARERQCSHPENQQGKGGDISKQLHQLLKNLSVFQIVLKYCSQEVT